MTPFAKKIYLFFLFPILVFIILYFSCPKIFISMANIATEISIGADESSLKVKDINWSYLDNKNMGKPVLVFVHGFTANKYRFGSFPANFKNNYRIIIPDLPGFGKTRNKKMKKYGVAIQAKRLHAFLNKLNIKKVNLFGSSMGGGIVSYYAYLYPKEVSSLAIADGMGVKWTTPSRGWKLLRSTGKNYFIPENVPEFDIFLSLVFYNPPYIPKQIKKIIVFDRQMEKEHIKLIFTQLTKNQFILQDKLKKIKVKTIIFWGREDSILPVSSAYEFHKGIKKSKLHIFEKCGHIPFYEKRSETATVYKKFLRN